MFKLPNASPEVEGYSNSKERKRNGNLPRGCRKFLSVILFPTEIGRQEIPVAVSGMRARKERRERAPLPAVGVALSA